MRLRNILNPFAYGRFLERKLLEWRACRQPNWRGTVWFPPGHFYSPLLDIEQLSPGSTNVAGDGVEDWAHVPLRPEAQRAYYASLVNDFNCLPFPREKSPEFRYFFGKEFFGSW